MIRNTLMGTAAALAISLGSAGAESLRFAGATPALTMDPHATNDFTTTAIFRQVYDSLIGLDLEMELVPALATDWEYAGDATWRFTIREGVAFHDGSEMTAEDVAFSIMRQKDSRFYRSLFGSITDANVVDDRTVEVVSSAPDPILPRKMSRMFIVSKSWAEANEVVEIPDLGAEGAEAHSIRNAMGTGPMQLVSHDPSGETRLTAFNDYWGERPGNLTAATYLTIGAGPTRVAALLSGEIDLVVDTPLQDVGRIEAAPGFGISEIAQLLWMQLELDGTRDQALETFGRDGNPLDTNPFRDTRVRQAIAHAVDAEAIVDRIMRGRARVVGIASIPGYGGYQEDMDSRWETNVDRARELLSDAGYPDGFVTTMNCPLERYVNTDDICRAAASMLARIGIEVRVNGMVWPEFARMLVNGPDSSFHLIGMSPDSRDTQDAFTGYIITRNPDENEGFFNWALFSDDEIDEMTRQLTETFEEDERDELYRRLLARAKDQVNAVYLHQPTIVWSMREGVEAPIRADATVTLQNVTVR